MRPYGVEKREHGVIGIGYEATDLSAFVHSLTGWGVTRVFDVRLTPASRRPGFTKKTLAAALEVAGIEYVHLPQLGNPRDNRNGYQDSADSPAGLQARQVFLTSLSSDVANEAVDEIVAEARKNFVAVMCYEQSELNCHRKQVLDVIRRRLDL